ncbi:MAG: ABC transporter permease [Acidobacteriota bacterium]|nr:ABC transporter permease [Acidobacteriota bacterium]
MLALTAVNLMRRSGRTALSALGVAFGVTTVVALLALTGGLERSAGGLAHLGRADFGIFQAGLSDLTASTLPQSTLTKVRAIPGVAETTPVQIIGGALTAEPSTLTFGAEPESFLARRLVLVAGHRMNGQEAMVGNGAAATLHLHAGQRIDIYGRSLPIAGIYSSGIPLEDSGVVIPLSLARQLSGRPEDLSMIAVAISPGYREARLRHEIERTIPGTAAIGAPGELARVDTNSRIIHEAAIIVAVLALALGAVIVLNSMALAMIERRLELDILTALGFSQLRIFALLLGESLAVSVLGGALGLGLGVIAAEAVVGGLDLSVFVTPDITAWVLIRGALVGLALGVLGALFAAWRIMRMPLLASLRQA